MNTPAIFQIPRRTPNRLIAVELNPFQILAAEISRPRSGPVTIETAAEFNRDDFDGLRRWIENREGRRSQIHAICGLVAERGIVHRETVEPARLADPTYLEEVAEEQQKGRFLTATPFKIFNAKTWVIRALGAVGGERLPAHGAPVPALVCAIARDEVLAAQERLDDCRLASYRLEPGLLSLFGAVYKNVERRGSTHAVVVVVIHQNVTAAYILGKDGVHTPNPVLHGLDSIIELGRKELGEIDERAVLSQLQLGSAELIKQGAKLVRRIGRDLKPLMDSFEMTTGQPVDELLCAYLPPNLSWIIEPLAQATGRTPLAVDYAGWLPAAGLRISDGGPTFGPHWLGALSLAANLPDPAQPRAREDPLDRPWHVGYSVADAADERRLTSRKTLTAALAGALAAFVLVLSAWQLYVTFSLRADTHYWEEQISANRRLLERLNGANATLKTQTALLDRAYELMGDNYQLTNLILNLGRLLPPRMRIDRIETNDTRVAISGSMLEPAEEAAITLGKHIQDIRQHAELGPLFANVGITSLQRKSNSEAVLFELTLRFKPPSP